MSNHNQSTAIKQLLPHAEARQETLRLLALNSPQYQTRYEDCRHAVSYAYEALQSEPANPPRQGSTAITRIWSLPPDPEGMNNDRAEWAGAALRPFQSVTGTEFDDALTDLLGDLMHWCDRNAVNFDHDLARARMHYEAETAEEAAPAVPPTEPPKAPPAEHPATSEQENTVATRSYRAEFFTAADYAIGNFEAAAPEQALQMARKFYDDDIGELDFRSYDDNAGVDQIQIWDSNQGVLASWESDGYRLRNAAPAFLAALRFQTEAGKAVIAHWEQGDLATAVRRLNAAIARAETAIAQAVPEARHPDPVP